MNKSFLGMWFLFTNYVIHRTANFKLITSFGNFFTISTLSKIKTLGRGFAIEKESDTCSINRKLKTDAELDIIVVVLIAI